MRDFEKAFGDFVEGEEYDRMENDDYTRLKDVLFSMLRTAYKCGWKAAGGILTENCANDIAAVNT